ncbi:MAG: hypothetical protein E7022_08120 [Desulfovibrio desulfuricans]|jgi:hypothetical protein|nr:hypothetical protein [Desulfovibrio desulfuricans]
MYSLRSLYRIMLLVWLALVLCMGCIVAHNAGTEGSGSLFAFLFPDTREPAPLPPVVVKEAPKPAPVPVITPPTEEPARPQTEWIALQKGKKAGKGSLGKPEITSLDNGDVEVRFACSDAPGNFREFFPATIDSLSIDLMGAWGKGMRVDKRPDRGVLKRVQIADHKQWLRVSGIARESTDKLEARVEYAPTLKALRIVFTKQQ